MKIFSYLEIIFRCVVLLYLNYLFECCNKIHAWLYDDTPYLIIVLSKVGVSWLSCFIVILLLIISLICFDIKCKVNLFLNFLIFVIFGSICFVLVIVFNSVVPMIAGFYPFYPSNLWDFVILFFSFVVCVGSIWKKVKSIGSVKASE